MTPPIDLAYDSQIITYYCFSIELPIHGRRVPIKYNSHTDKIQEFTRKQIDKNNRLGTINQAWEEVSDDAAGLIVDDLFKDRSFQVKLENEGIPITWSVQLYCLERLQTKLRKLFHKGWFEVVQYNVDRANKTTMREFFRDLDNTPKMQAHLRRKGRKSPIPEGADIPLILFSCDHSIPVLSNDSDLTKFRQELVGAGFNAHIIAFSEI